MTRDLDRKVAEILGWRFDEAARVPQWSSPGHHRDAVRCPAYSTDYAELPEMLAWLRSGTESHLVLREYVSVVAKCPQWISTMRAGGRIESSALAATLPEAIAMLVVAVHEKEP